MKLIRLPLLLTVLGGSATAQTFNIDLNTANGTAGADWNVFAAPGDINGSTLTPNTGGSSGVTFSASGNIVDSTGSGLSNDLNRPSWVSAAAGDDFFWTDNNGTGGGESFTLTFDGMAVGSTVSLDVYASRDSTASVFGTYEYSLDGGNSWFGFDVLKNDGSAETADGWDSNDTQSQTFHINNDGYDHGRYLNISEITLTGSSIQVRITENTADDAYIGINAMQLAVIPEPQSFAMLAGLMCLASVMLRRRI